MSLCGIIAEYNPLHFGHAYQIEKAREVSGCEHIAVVMSGAFVQRGEAAAFDKWARAKWALLAGADVVFELPAAYALQAASGFAAGGVRTLAATGMLEALSFGCEHGGGEELFALCGCFGDERYDSLVKANLSLGMSYAKAEQEALAALSPELSRLVQKPNFLLGLSYARAVSAFAPEVRLATVRRQGADYNDSGLFGRFSFCPKNRRKGSKPSPRFPRSSQKTRANCTAAAWMIWSRRCFTPCAQRPPKNWRRSPGWTRGSNTRFLGPVA